MENIKFYICDKCGEIQIVFGSDALVCCGENPRELKANTVDAAVEKHVPAVTKENGNIVVTVGSVLHPMDVDHYITKVIYVTEENVEVVDLEPMQEPKAVFADKEVPAEVYAYCNKHGLWKTEIN